MVRHRNRILVPEARSALDQLKVDVVKESGAVNPETVTPEKPDDVKFAVADKLDVPLKKGDNGELTTRQAGRIGGQMGGSMVKRLIEMAQQELVDRQSRDT